MALPLPNSFSISLHFRLLVFLVARDDYNLIHPSTSLNLRLVQFQLFGQKLSKAQRGFQFPVMSNTKGHILHAALTLCSLTITKGLY